MKLAAGVRMNLAPAALAVVLQTRDVGAEEGRKLVVAARALTLVARLVVEHVRFDFHLKHQRQRSETTVRDNSQRQQSETTAARLI